VLVAVPDQRPVVTSIVWPSHVYVLVLTFVGVVAVSVALTAARSAVFQCATAAPVATRALRAAATSVNRFFIRGLLRRELTRIKTLEL
jgi:hypothetical protein